MDLTSPIHGKSQTRSDGAGWTRPMKDHKHQGSSFHTALYYLIGSLLLLLLPLPSTFKWKASPHGRLMCALTIVSHSQHSNDDNDNDNDVLNFFFYFNSFFYLAVVSWSFDISFHIYNLDISCMYENGICVFASTKMRDECVRDKTWKDLSHTQGDERKGCRLSPSTFPHGLNRTWLKFERWKWE